MQKNKLKAVFMGGGQAGIIGCLCVLSQEVDIIAGVGYCPQMQEILRLNGIPSYPSIKDVNFVKEAGAAQLLLCVHGREIAGADILGLSGLTCINVHPYLYKYKGADPLGRALKDGEFKASVGAHIMTGEVDSGEVIYEEFQDIANPVPQSREEMYNRLYPLYARVILRVLLKIKEGG